MVAPCHGAGGSAVVSTDPAPSFGSSQAAVSLSVVICCYTLQRWQGLTDAVAAVLDALTAEDELIIVVDGNDLLLQRLTDEPPDPTGRHRVSVIANSAQPGLSGARNTGVAAAHEPLVVFLDDDAVLRPAALDAVRASFADPGVTALGGAVWPAWESGHQPHWFPPEFGWVVGCDYRGLPTDGAPIRNPIGAAMAVRRDALVEIGGFSRRLGRVATVPAGCEETMMGIELVRRNPQATIIRQTSFAVDHTVPRDRMTMAYFVRRCFHEGRSKAVLTRLCGRQSALHSERSYTTRTLPSGVWRARRHPRRIVALVVGFVVTGVGYVTGSVTTAVRKDHR